MAKLPSNAKPLYPDIRFVAPEEVGPSLRRALEAASSGVPCDCDKAVVLGTKARELDRSVVEREVAQFLLKPVPSQRIEAAGWFLAAFWIPESEPNEMLVHQLCDSLDSTSQPAEVKSALILALASAHSARISPILRHRIRGSFQNVGASVAGRPQEDVVAAAMQKVLTSTD
jgi:hypothetical protein